MPENCASLCSLEVSYAYSTFGPYHDHALVVRQAGSLVLFVLDAAGPGRTELADTELELSTGEPSCPWSIVESGSCSEAHFHTIAQSGDEVVTDPCGSPVGSFIVSSVTSGSSGTRCGAPIGSYDGASRSLASGVRTD